jgi:hypothetical protein
LEVHREELAEWDKMRSLARRVLAGESAAYLEAVSELSSLSEISTLGHSIHLKVESPRLIHCVLNVKSRDVVPSEAKSITAAGKLSVKTMPKGRAHEIYQDYVCGCALRLARELLALLPVDTVIASATVSSTDKRTGRTTDVPVLSVAFPRSAVARLDFERLDPSDSIENFQHRGDVTASKKSGDFVAITPLSTADLPQAQQARPPLATIRQRARQLRSEIGFHAVPAAPIAAEELEPSTSLE